MRIYDYDKNCDCIQVAPESKERLENLKEYLDYLRNEIMDVKEEIARIECN